MSDGVGGGVGLGDGVGGESGDAEDTQDNVDFDEDAEDGDVAIQDDLEAFVPNAVKFGDADISQPLGSALSWDSESVRYRFSNFLMSIAVLINYIYICPIHSS